MNPTFSPSRNVQLPALVLLLSGLLMPFTGQAQQPPPLADDQQPVHITADSLHIQDQQGISIYTGNVEVTQGSLTLTGDKITLHHPQREIDWIQVEGQPATFKRFDPQQQAWINGRADFIDYQATAKTVLLTGNAEVEQTNKHRITGPKLFYDLQNKTLQAQSSDEEKKRISVTLMPENPSEEEPNTTPPSP